MKRAASPSILTEVEESTMVVEGVEEVILHDEKRLKTEAEEVCIDEGWVVVDMTLWLMQGFR